MERSSVGWVNGTVGHPRWQLKVGGHGSLPQIMEIHVTKHHQAYVTNLNAALVQYAEVCFWVRHTSIPHTTCMGHLAHLPLHPPLSC